MNYGPDREEAAHDYLHLCREAQRAAGARRAVAARRWFFVLLSILLLTVILSLLLCGRVGLENP